MLAQHALGLASLVLAGLALVTGAAAAADPSVQQISSDPYANPSSQHAAEVEPDTFSYGGTVVAAFQAGRFSTGGASGIGFATSTDRGKTWASGFLPSLTVFSTPAGSFDRVSDPSVAYDASHRTWLISMLALEEPCTLVCISSIVVSRSTGGRTWSAPITIAPPIGSFAHDKNWTVCDNSPTSALRGRCYTSFTDFSNSSRIVTSTSLDGGQTWGIPVGSADPGAVGLGAQPLVRPDGSLVIPFLSSAGEIAAIRSTDGGSSFSLKNVIAAVNWHAPTGIRSSALPSAEVDGAGTIYVAWDDCRFRAGCAGPDSAAPNDVVYSTSTDGFAWTAPARVPIDEVTSGVDHFIPGLAVDPQTQGAATRLGLTYYSFSSTPCSFTTCELNVGFIGSTSGGATWGSPVQLNAQPMSLASLPETNQGRMVGDYVSTSFVEGGLAVPVFALASPADLTFHQAMFSAAVSLSPPPPPPPPPSPPPPPPLPPPTTQPATPPPDAREPAAAPSPRLRLSIITSSTSPQSPKAGRKFTARVRVRRSDSGGSLQRGSVACSARVAGQALRASTKSLSAGLATCIWKIPARARGKRIRGSVGVSYRGSATSWSFSFTVT